MSTDDFPTNRHGPPHSAEAVVREWSRRGFGGQIAGPPDEELPSLAALLEDAGLEVPELDYDKASDEISITYSRPDEMDPERGVELVATAFIAAADRGPWNDIAVTATDGTVEWEIAANQALSTAAIDGASFELVSNVFRHSISEVSA